MELFDFDGYFTDYLNAWIEKNQARFKRPEDMEDEAPDVYLRWLNEKADWLNGKTPGEYFEQFDDAQLLVDWLEAYTHSDVAVPDVLQDRIAELDSASEQPLLHLALCKDAPCEARMTAIALLRQIDSRAPMVDFIRWQVERQEDDDLLDNALESLHEMGDGVLGPCKIAFAAADEAGKEALLDVLCDFPAEDMAVTFAIEQFKKTPDKRALYAGYLGKLGDDRALEPLLDVAEGNDVSYIDFIEIRNAIERLGGEAPVRDFQNDPTYLAMRRLQQKPAKKR